MRAPCLRRSLRWVSICSGRALSCQASVISFVLGWSSCEANGSMHDHLDEMLGFDAIFDLGLRALVAGFEQQLKGDSA